MATLQLQDLRQYNGDLTENDLMLFKIKRRVDMPADEDMGVRYSQFLQQINLERFVKKAGDTMSGDLVFQNNRGIFGTTTTGASRSLFKLTNADAVAVGNTNNSLILQSLVDPKVTTQSGTYTLYHTGNANISTIDWSARNITAHQTLSVLGESTMANLSIKKLSAIYGYDAGNLKVRMIGIDADDDVAVGVTTKRFGILVKDPNEIWAVQEEGNPAKQWRVLTTGNFTSHLNSTYVLKTQTVNGKALTGNITLSAADVGALAATGKVVSSNYGNALTLQGDAPSLTLQELDTGKQYHIICDGNRFRINENTSTGNTVMMYEMVGTNGRLLSTSAALRVSGLYSTYTGQNGWQIPITATSNMAITSLARPSGADQYAGIGVHDSGTLFGWNHLSAKNYAFEINTEEAKFYRTISENGQRVYSPNNKPTNIDVGLGNVPNLVHSASTVAETVVVRDVSGDVHGRLFKSSYPNDDAYTELGALAFRVSPTDGYTRYISDKAKINSWLGSLSRDIVNINYSNNWADIVGKIPCVTPTGVIELGKYIDLRDTNSNNDFDVRLSAIGSTGSQSLNIETVNGSIEIGAKNTTYAHIYTNRSSFYFNKGVLFNGNCQVNSGYLILQYNGRRHIRFDDSAGVVDGYIYKEPSSSWCINHGNKAQSELKWSPNGELVVDGQRWAASHAHSFAGQVGLTAPVHVNFGTVGGGSDYYPIIRGVSISRDYGYTTQVDLGCLREGGGQWGKGILRVASHESSSHPSAVYFFTIDGDFTAPRNGRFNDVYISSDESLKTNLKPLENSLAGIMQLEPTEYDKRLVASDVYDIHEEGLIAQAVEKVFPNAVHTDDSSGLKSLKPYALIARLIGAIQEQQKMIEELKNGN